MDPSTSAALSAISENLDCLPGDVPVLVLRAADGACATVALHGGHLLSWVPAGGRERMYLSPRSGFAPGQAIRGGVPVIFPQFSDRGPLQRHGFARMLPWQVLRQDCGADSASAVLRLTDTSHTRALWPHGFALELTLQVGSDALSLQLACRNTGADSFRFQAALHSYFRVGDLSRCILTGLEGRRYWDALDRAERQQTGPVALADGDLDRVYSRVAEPLRLQEAAGHGQARCAQIGQQGFEDVVVWNPGAAKCAALADMPAQGWRHMVCVEAARIHAPITLAPGESWHGTQTVRCQAPVP